MWVFLRIWVETYSPAYWVHLLASRFSLKVEQLRQRTPPAMRSPLSLTVVPVEVVRSGAGRLCSGLPLRAGHHTELPWVLRMVCHVFALGVSSSRWSPVELTQRWHESHSWTLTSCPLP